jgi:hypothetical protein
VDFLSRQESGILKPIEASQKKSVAGTRLRVGTGWAGVRGRSARIDPVRAQFYLPQPGPEPKRSGPGWAGFCQGIPR